MISEIIYHKYPQYIWAGEINDFMESGLIKGLKGRKIIDIPCGSGIISFWLKKKNPELDFELYDCDEKKIKFAKTFIGDLTIAQKDVYEYSSDRNNDIWLFINSLYCLPDAEELLDRMKAHMEYVIGIFPYIDHPNYRTYIESRSGSINPSEMNKAKTIELFRKNGYNLLKEKDVTFLCFYRIKSQVVRKPGLYLLGFFDRFYRNKAGAYWIALFGPET